MFFLQACDCQWPIIVSCHAADLALHTLSPYASSLMVCLHASCPDFAITRLLPMATQRYFLTSSVAVVTKRPIAYALPVPFLPWVKGAPFLDNAMEPCIWRNRQDSNPRCYDDDFDHSSTIPVRKVAPSYSENFLVLIILCIWLRGYAHLVTLVLPSSSMISTRSLGNFHPKCYNQSLLNIWN